MCWSLLKYLIVHNIFISSLAMADGKYEAVAKERIPVIYFVPSNSEFRAHKKNTSLCLHEIYSLLGRGICYNNNKKNVFSLVGRCSQSNGRSQR